MPLIVMTGVPSSGKTQRAKQIAEYFLKEGKEVHIISESEEIIKAGFEKNSFYQDSNKEKQIRGFLKSEVLKHIGPRNLVILDALNYIKGYRYELYCATKANNCTQCTVQTEINREEAWNLNIQRENESDKYSREIFDALVMRYEDPDMKNRWDSPLFVLLPHHEIDFEEISNCLFEKKPPPPNMSTQNAPLNSTNYLYDMNRMVKEITSSLVSLIQKGARSEVEIPGHENLTIDLRNVKVQKLISLSRQYLTYSKMHAPDISQVPQLYIQFLKSNLN